MRLRARVVVVLLVSAALAACSRAANSGSRDTGEAGSGGAGGSGGEAGPGPGGSGGAGGQGGTGGEGGSGGAGGSGGCPGLPEAECGPVEWPFVAAWLPQANGTSWGWHSVRDFELSGWYVGRQPYGRDGDEALVFRIPPDDETLIVGLRPGPTEVDPPLAPGDEATVAFDASSQDLVGAPWHVTLRLLDAAGRLRWGFDDRENLPEASVFGRDFETLARTPSCHSPGTVVERIDLDLSSGGGPPFHVTPGTVTPFEGSASGRFYLSASWQTAPQCTTPEDFESRATAMVRIDEPGSLPDPCLLDADCAPDRYCERGAGACDRAGWCRPRPPGCRARDAMGPACGCDGRAYPTPCEARLAGTDAPTLAPDCPGLFACSWTRCRTGEAACLRTRRVPGAPPALPFCAVPGVDLPLSDDCDPEAPTCACFQRDWADRPCTCVEPSPGVIHVECDG